MNISQIKVELAINETALQSATLFEEKLQLLTQRAMLKDMLIEALTEQLAKVA